MEAKFIEDRIRELRKAIMTTTWDLSNMQNKATKALKETRLAQYRQEVTELLKSCLNSSSDTCSESQDGTMEIRGLPAMRQKLSGKPEQ
ncbi:MAG: hypothetical protein ABH879_01775 [archaeon]